MLPMLAVSRESRQALNPQLLQDGFLRVRIISRVKLIFILIASQEGQFLFMCAQS